MAEVTRRGSVWILVGIRGLIMLAFGLYATFFPGVALAGLVILGGAILLVDGLLGLWSHTFGGGRTGNFWFDVVRNVLAILVGALILISPLLATVFTVTVLVYIVALQALIVGGMEFYRYWQNRGRASHGWPVALSGAVYFLLGLMLVFFPIESAVAVVTVGGVLMILFSIGLFALAFRLWRAGI